MKKLSKKQKDVLNKAIELAAILVDMTEDQIKVIDAYVLEHGTDHEKGSVVDELVQDMLGQAEDRVFMRESEKNNEST